MRRRDFVKGIVAVPIVSRALLAEQTVIHKGTVPPQSSPKAPMESPLGVGAEPPEVIGGGVYKRQFPMVSGVPDQFAETTVHFFTDTQQAALRRLCDVLMPPLEGYPGALEAGVPEFLDFLVSASPTDRQEMYRSGLDHLNVDAKKRFGISFEKVNAEQAHALLRPWLRVWTQHRPPSEPQARFVNEAHDDIRRATMNSRAWNITAAALGDHVPGIGLYWSLIDPDFPNAYTAGELAKRGKGHC